MKETRGNYFGAGAAAILTAGMILLAGGISAQASRALSEEQFKDDCAWIAAHSPEDVAGRYGLDVSGASESIAAARRSCPQAAVFSQVDTAAPARAGAINRGAVADVLGRVARDFATAVRIFDGKRSDQVVAAGPVGNYVNGIEISDQYAERTFKQSLPNTLQTTVHLKKAGTTYVSTGDIPAMWVRDSCAQVYPYVYMAAGSPDLQRMIRGVILSHMKHFNSPDPDAPFVNAWRDHNTPVDRILAHFMRGLEPDGVASLIRLAWLYWKITGDDSWAHQTGDLDARKAFDRALDMIKAKTGPTGMVKCPYRPSDDPTKYPYLIPTNMFLAATLPKLAEMYSALWNDSARARDAAEVAGRIRDGIQRYGTVQHPVYGTIWAYEVDGQGKSLLMDDANVPSLLSAPYLEYCAASDPVYRNTRKFVLSPDNPYYGSGSHGSGIGSPHTPRNRVWPMAVIMQALTSDDPSEIQGLLKELDNLDAGTHSMHESVDPDNPKRYSRYWFAWANSLYGEMVIKKELGLNYYPGDGTYVNPKLNPDWSRVDMNLPVTFGDAQGITLRLSGQGAGTMSAAINGRAAIIDPQKGVKITGNGSDVVIQTRPSQ